MLTLSNTPTDYILVKATNDSEWFCSDFAIIQLSSVVPILEEIKETGALFMLKNISYSMCIVKGNVTFYDSDDDSPDFIYDFVNDESETAPDYHYVDYDYDRDHQELGELEIRQGTVSIDVSTFGGVSLTRSAKHSSDECFCYLPNDFIPNFE